MQDDRTLGPFLKNSFGDKYLFEVNGTAFDKVGSANSFKKHYGKELFEENSLYVFVGSDSALLPKYIIEEGLPDGSYYLFIEPHQILDKLKEVCPDLEFHKKIIMTTADHWLVDAEKINYQNFVYLGNLKFISSFSAIDGRLSEYLELSNHLQEELEKIRWSLNAELGSELFQLRQLENLPENRISVSCLQGVLADKTAIVLGGGPSLDGILPWVIENRNHLTVIAVSRIARRLQEVQLSPDIIVSIDPQQISFDVSKEMLEFWPKAFFVNKYHVVGTLLGQWVGRSFFLGPRVPWDSPLNEDTIDAPGPTVTNSAIDLAVKMGCARVLLAGVDLCHSKDGYTHAKGSNERDVGPQLGKGKLWVETNGGWQAETTPDYHFAATQIGSQARYAGSRGCQLVNLSENATRIDGVEFCPPGEVTFQSGKALLSEDLLALVPVESPQSRSTYYKGALSDIAKARKAFIDIRKLAIEALKANACFFGTKGHDKGNRKYRLKMDRVEKRLSQDYSTYSTLVKKIGIRDFLKITQGDQHKDWDENDAERLGRVYYEAYRDSSSRLIEMVNVAADRLRSRLEEEKVDPDFSMMIVQWQKDNQPGRSRAWKVAHPDREIPNEYIESFKEMDRRFEETMQLMETPHLQRTRTVADLRQVRGKLSLMYKQKQTDNLHHLVDSLSLLESPEAASLAFLAKGYRAELQGDPERAINEYQQLCNLYDESQGLELLEDALKRLFSLSLQNNDQNNARMVVDCLAGISVTYLPYKADYLWLTGEQQDALDVYADYLEYMPEDHDVMLKLGRRYLEIGHSEGATFMFETVLQQDGSNQAAHLLLNTISGLQK